MITIDSRWVKKDFKQKYFLLCNKCGKITPQKVAQLKDNTYICGGIIKIEEI